jgi:hypothetical protein
MVVSGNSKLRSVTVCTLDRKNPKPKPTTEKPVAPRRRGDAEKTKDKSSRKGAFRKAGVEEQGVIDLSWREICEKKQDFEVLSLHSDFDFFSASPHLRGAIVFGFGRQCCNRSGLAVSLD